MDLFHISSVSLSPVRTVTFHSSFPCFNKAWGTYITVSYEVAYFSLALSLSLSLSQQLPHTESLFYSRLLMGLHNKSNPAC